MKSLTKMEELYKILYSNSRVLKSLGFIETNTKTPKGNSFSISWYHEGLSLHFTIVWDRMEMMIVSANFGAIKKYQAFHKLLDTYCIDFDLDKLNYPVDQFNQFDITKFEEALSYNLKKFGELLMVI